MADGRTPMTLGDVLTLEYGRSLPERARDGFGHPVYGSSGVVGRHSQPLVAGPGIVVGRKGTAGSVLWTDDDFFPIDTTYWVKLRDERSIDLRFTALLLESLDLPEICAQTGVPGLNRERAYELSVFLPRLVEQRRIVDLIGAFDSQIEALKSERWALELTWQAQVQQLDAGSGRVRLGEVLERIDAGKSPSGDERLPGPGEKAVLRVNSIEHGRFNPLAVKTVDASVDLPETLAVRRGDVLMVRANGVLSRVGQVCQVLIEPQRLYLCDKTLRLVVRPDVLLPSYLRHALSSDLAREQIEALTAGSHMRNLSQQAIRQLEIPLPELEDQHSLAAALDATLSQAEALGAELIALLEFRSGLLSALLNGEVEIGDSYDALLDEAI